MSRLSRNDLDEFEVYVSRVATFTEIPAAHIEKDSWVTEVFRGIAMASRNVGCSIVFKGGTSLSKAHRLIQRFSEDVDRVLDSGVLAGHRLLAPHLEASKAFSLRGSVLHDQQQRGPGGRAKAAREFLLSDAFDRGQP